MLFPLETQLGHLLHYDAVSASDWSPPFGVELHLVPQFCHLSVG